MFVTSFVVHAVFLQLYPPSFSTRGRESTGMYNSWFMSLTKRNYILWYYKLIFLIRRGLQIPQTLAAKIWLQLVNGYAHWNSKHWIRIWFLRNDSLSASNCMVYHMQISVQCCQFHGNIALLRAQWSHFGPNFWARKMAHITVRASLLKFGLRDGPGLNQFLLVVPRDGTGPKKGPARGPYGPFTVRA